MEEGNVLYLEIFDGGTSRKTYEYSVTFFALGNALLRTLATQRRRLQSSTSVSVDKASMCVCTAEYFTPYAFSFVFLFLHHLLCCPPAVLTMCY